MTNFHFPQTGRDSNVEGVPGPPHSVPLLEDSPPQPCSWEATFCPDLSIKGNNHDGECNCEILKYDLTALRADNKAIVSAVPVDKNEFDEMHNSQMNFRTLDMR